MYSDFYAYKTLTRNVTGWSSTIQSTEMLLKDDLDVTEWHSYDQPVTFEDLCYLAVDWTAELHPLCVIWPRFLFYFQHIKMSWYPCPKYLWFTNQNQTSFVSCLLLDSRTLQVFDTYDYTFIPTHGHNKNGGERGVCVCVKHFSLIHDFIPLRRLEDCGHF